MSGVDDADYEYVTVATDEPGERVATVTIDRPDARNALNDRVRRELIDAFETLEAADEIRVAVVTGSDESKAFVAGADITEFEGRSVVEQREAGKRPGVYDVVADLEIPVIARIDGFALGGGCELAMACDVRLASERSTLGQPEINLGIIPGGGGTQRLPRLVGDGHAKRLVLSGELVDAEEAREIGLVDEVYPYDELDDRVADLSGSMAEKSPIALEIGKEAVDAAGRMSLEDGLDYEKELFSVLFSTEDRDEGVAAFLADREPEFEGR